MRSASPARTMFAALHGSLVPHPLPPAGGAASDAYSLFVARSSAMGWLAGPADEGPSGLWGMNDAGPETPPSQSRASRVAWFQVTLTGRGAERLPVQPFLACARDVTARMGKLRLDAVQLVLPARGSPARRQAGYGPTTMALLQEAQWFADCDASDRARVRVTLDGGQDSTILAAAPAMLDWLCELRQEVFSPDAARVMDSDDAPLTPAIADELWLGPSQHRATFVGGLAEWSLEAVAWLAALLAESSSGHGVGTPLLLTAGKFGGCGEARP